MSLLKYKQKRSFSSTPEPSGRKRTGKTKALEFVVQKHHASHLHYDFRLEMDGVLKSWAVPKGPSLNPSDKRLAMMVEDHPYEYRKFEGQIPKGNYGAGDVIIWDRGIYQPLVSTDRPELTLLKELKDGHLSFVMSGQKLKGEFALIKSPHMGENAWLLVKKNDDFASSADVTRQQESVVSGREVEGEGSLNVAKLPKSKMPNLLKPMLATLSDQAFDDDDWLYEIKWDGYRAVGSWDGHQVDLYSRNGNNFAKYTPVKEALRRMRHQVVLDGEVVVVDEKGKSNFGWLQDYGRSQQGQLLYYVFDILWLDGREITSLPLIERKKILKSVLGEDPVVRYSDHVIGQGTAFYKSAEAEGLEGIMAKKMTSKYQPGRRSQQWLKVKTHKRQEAVIAGFTEPKGSRKHIGALILGVYKQGELTYIGHTGGGIPPKDLPALRRKLESIERQTSPFKQKVKPNAPVHWVTPKLICEISFSEWTADGHMRQPIFIGLRSDKSAKDVKREMPLKIATNHKSSSSPDSQKSELTHLNKVFFPKLGYTKGDLVKYYESVGETMLKYLKSRPHSLLRQPNGIAGTAFFQKDMPKVPPGIRTTEIYSESNEKNISYLVCDSLTSLLYMVQLGCIEINPWNSRVDNLSNPDWVVIDLDPEKINFKEVVKVAKVVQALCQELKIPAYPKTSGKTGIHIYIPLHAKYDYSAVKQFAEILANLIHSRIPNTTSLERSPTKRQGKIYIDFLQNRQGQTLAAPYSVRPTEVASVSTPLHWDEVTPNLKPEKFTIKNTNKRLARVGELWCPVVGKGIDIVGILKLLS